MSRKREQQLDHLVAAALAAVTAAEEFERQMREIWPSGDSLMMKVVQALSLARRFGSEVSIIEEALKQECGWDGAPTPTATLTVTSFEVVPPPSADIPLDGLSQGRLGALLTRLEREAKAKRRAGESTAELDRQIGRVKERLWGR